MASTKTPSKTCTAQTAAAKMGITHGRLSALAKDEPTVFAPHKGWTPGNIARAQKRLEERRATANSDGRQTPAGDEEIDGDVLAAIKASPERRAKLSLIVERAAKIKLERELLAGVYVSKREVDDRSVQRIMAVKNRFLELPAMAGQLVGLNESEISAKLTGWIKEACESFAHAEQES